MSSNEDQDISSATKELTMSNLSIKDPTPESSDLPPSLQACLTKFSSTIESSIEDTAIESDDESDNDSSEDDISPYKASLNCRPLSISATFDTDLITAWSDELRSLCKEYYDFKIDGCMENCRWVTVEILDVSKERLTHFQTPLTLLQYLPLKFQAIAQEIVADPKKFTEPLYLQIYAEELCESCGLSFSYDKVEECDRCEGSMKVDPKHGYWVHHCHGCQGEVNSDPAIARKKAKEAKGEVAEAVWGIPNAVLDTLTSFYRKREADDRHANCFVLNISFNNGENVAFNSAEIPPAHPLVEVDHVPACVLSHIRSHLKSWRDDEYEVFKTFTVGNITATEECTECKDLEKAEK